MQDKTCENCKHFVRHYIKYANGYYHAVSYGHCVYPRIKKRYVDGKACTHWKEKE